MIEEPTQVPGLVRDLSTGALINKDADALVAYKRRKNEHRTIRLLQQNQWALEQRLASTETSLNEIKELLMVLINNK